MDSPFKAEAWFVRVVISGLQRLLALSLVGSPRSDAARLTAQAWTEVLWESAARWDEARDTPRIAMAFKYLARTSVRWPAPVELIEALPPLLPTLPGELNEPGLSAEDRARNRERVRELVEMLAHRKTHFAVMTDKENEG